MTIEVAYIEWIDSHAGSGQFGEAEVLKALPVTMRSGGIFVGEDESQVTIAQDVFKIDETEKQIRSYLVIPKINIRRIKRWKVGAEKKGRAGMP